MIRTVQGVVAAINVKADVKDFGNGPVKNFGIQIDGEWYNGMVNEDKRNAGSFPIKTGKADGYTEITKGSEVTLCLKKNAKGYENINLSQSYVTKPAVQAPSAPIQPAVSASAQQQAPAKPAVDWEKKDLQMNIGGLLHDASALVSAMIAADGAPKTMLKAAAKDPEAKGFDDTAVLGMVRHYTLELYKLKEGIITEIQTGKVDDFDDEMPF